MQAIFARLSPRFDEILNHPDHYRLQILYTRIDRDDANRPSFTSKQFNVQTDRYFYPASSIKLPAAVLALEKLNRLGIDGLDRYTSLRIDSAYGGQTAVTADPSAPDSLPTIAHYIKKILLVSDNDAYNRLFEFLGQRYLNESFQKKGFSDVHIIRRLSVPGTPDQQRATNPFTFYRDADVIYRQPLVINPDTMSVHMPDVRQGKGYISNGKLIEERIDFSNSNYISLESLQGILRSVIFPDAVPAARRFDLSADEYRFLYRYMAMRPRESDIADYLDEASYSDGYVKFLMVGESKARIPAHIRIFSKSGMAYGYLIDNAYIVDFDNGIEFLLSAVVQVNANQIYNDDTYEYNQLGIPFLAALGRAVYEIERQRPRQHPPDFKRFDKLWKE